MSAADLPAHVAAFVSAHIRSIEDLHLIMVLVNEPGRWWDAAAVARELQISTRAAQRALEHFAQHNLLEIRLTNEVRYQFHPGTEDLRAGAIECVGAYRENPIALIRAISPGLRSIQDFADAFRIRPDDR